MVIGVIGYGLEDEALNELAEKTGALIAEAGCVLVNGGLGGVMRASARGCRSKGGLTVGILPGLDPGEANEYIDIPVSTGMGEMRNALIVRAASALIAIGGGYGTLSEIALALKSGKQVIGIKTWDVSAEVIKTESPVEAVRLALKAGGF
ncbi:MAG: TIGR00725 family protein [Deltaproteobacteria bacterium]|nr:TIGR00725 family protein [Deltaproteobacteria bacterium]MBZ0219185.1 TIGR00725 family protein [Deltaproteobacteria bacterium]